MVEAEGGYADGDGDQGGPESDDDDNDGKAGCGEPSRRGPPAGHIGASHKSKADRTVVLRVCRCGTCGRGHLRKMPPVVKMVYDFAGGNFWVMECIAYVMRRGSCRRCGGMITAAAPTIPGTSFGPGIPGFIEEYYPGRCTNQTTSYFFDALYGFDLSPNAVWNARKATGDLLMGAYMEILDHIAEAPFMRMDESPVRMNGKRDYIRLATVGDATYIVAAPAGWRPSRTSISGRSWASRSSRTDISSTTRCPSGRGAGCTSCARPKSTPSGTANPTYPATAACPPCTGPSGAGSRRKAPSASPWRGPSWRWPPPILRAASSGPSWMGPRPTCSPSSGTPACRPATTAPSWRYATRQSCTGTCATNCPRWVGVFLVPVSVARTCRKLGILPRTAVENLVRDPDWRLFRPPPKQERQELVAPVAAAC